MIYFCLNNENKRSTRHSWNRGEEVKKKKRKSYHVDLPVEPRWKRWVPRLWVGFVPRMGWCDVSVIGAWITRGGEWRWVCWEVCLVKMFELVFLAAKFRDTVFCVRGAVWFSKLHHKLNWQNLQSLVACNTCLTVFNIMWVVDWRTYSIQRVH